jgi:hypothetical protein
MKLRITAGKVVLQAEQRDTPAQTWGDEVYFSTPVSAKLESDAKQIEGDAKALAGIKPGAKIRVEKV